MSVAPDGGRHCSGLLESLPQRLIPAKTISSLQESDAVAQSVPVRGLFTAHGRLAYQAIVNLRHRRVVALHIDPDDPGGGWSVVYDSNRGTLDPPEGPSYYHRAHDALAARRFEPEGSHFENTPPGWAPEEKK